MNISRLPLVGGVAAGAVLLLAGPAFAHVTVEPGEAEKGGFSTLAVKVPNERDNASTVKVELNLPTDHPLASVMPQPVPGWDVKVTKSKLDKPIEMHGEKITEAVTKVTWTGGKVGPGQFQQFPLSVGQLPEDTDQLVLKAIQTYDNDETVRWIEAPKEGGEEPENPAPVLRLTEPAKGAGGHSHGSSEDAKAGHGHDSEGTEESGESGTAENASSDSSDTTARALGIVGIVVGFAGVAFGILAGRRRSA
ncbi:YcnI family copper-binding membrane protein [Streptomyces sp. 8N706]|uniref:YcnI family copper-binding membrane protein n=1 Tax=Streptomyces sp. 8N706 TaxID=3457416 RepID=UPI003FD49DAB